MKLNSILYIALLSNNTYHIYRQTEQINWSSGSFNLPYIKTLRNTSTLKHTISSYTAIPRETKGERERDIKRERERERGGDREREREGERERGGEGERERGREGERERGREGERERGREGEREREKEQILLSMSTIIKNHYNSVDIHPSIWCWLTHRQEHKHTHTHTHTHARSHALTNTHMLTYITYLSHNFSKQYWHLSIKLLT